MSGKTFVLYSGMTLQSFFPWDKTDPCFPTYVATDIGYGLNIKDPSVQYRVELAYILRLAYSGRFVVYDRQAGDGLQVEIGKYDIGGNGQRRFVVPATAIEDRLAHPEKRKTFWNTKIVGDIKEFGRSHEWQNTAEYKDKDRTVATFIGGIITVSESIADCLSHKIELMTPQEIIALDPEKLTCKMMLVQAYCKKELGLNT